MSRDFSAKLPMFENRLRKMYKHYSKLARRQEVACFRFYDHDLPEFPFAIELYKDVVHAAEYKRRHGMEDEEHEEWLAACKEVIAQVMEIPLDTIFMKERQRKAGRQGQYEKFSEERVERIVPEGGLNFIINLTDYLDTGLFLDHRITRNMVREEAKGKRVLNLFCYTGSFSVYAAHGGAKSVTSVDLSRTYINWAKRNMQYNKLYNEDKHEFVQDDVMAVISDIPADTFDLIICDPPTFSNSKRMEKEFDVQRDHVWLLKQLLKGCTDGGQIYFSNNYRGFELDRDAIPTPSIEDITAATTPFDFQGRLHRKCYLLTK
ncbi:class I SAM-dependent methyltransferase [Polluticoccus soli]|uniref:class I SAM-dependent methyltransferase n=1 Tax=Polluticoccus soli TaxID=3034150 RepID=UPI0023E34862|nr:class I SAM-dependent methyltransferase [Flavipsychrobacter sp. JY13-12]